MQSRRTLHTAFAAFAALACWGLAAAGPVAAKNPKPAARPPVAAPAPAATVSPEQQRTEANTRQAKAAQDQIATNAANKQAYEDAIKARDEKIARDKAEYEAKVASDKAAHDAAMKQWQAEVAACKAGKVNKCTKPI
jgi:hypothetical protein